MNRALFLDRDGVLIEDVSYPHKPEDLHINKNIIPHLKWAKKNGFLLIIVTNQAGIAKGVFTLEQYEEFHNLMVTALEENGVEIDATYFCPYHKDGIITPYNIDSEDRKPKPGMILKAVEKFNIDLKKSYMIGDKFSDIIDIDNLKCFVLKSRYTSDKPGTYNSIEAVFMEIENELS